MKRKFSLKKRRKRFIKPNTMAGVFFTIFFALLFQTSSELKLPLRWLASDAEAKKLMFSFQDFSVPAECILKNHDANSKNQLELFLEQQNKKESVGSFSLKALGGAVIFLDPKCESSIQELAKETEKKYGLVDNDNYFRYKSSPPRIYGGVKVEDNKCTESVFVDPSMVVSLEADQFPERFEEWKTLLWDDALHKTLPKDIFKTVGVILLPENARSSGTTQKILSGKILTSKNQEVSKWKVGFIYSLKPMIPKLGNYIPIETFMKQTMVNELSSVKRKSILTLFKELDVLIQEEAKILNEYWNKTSRGTVPNGDMTELFLRFENLQPSESLLKNIPSEDWDEALMHLENFERQMMNFLSLQVVNSQRFSEAIPTASYWWAMRSAYISLFVDESTNKAMKDGDIFIRRQYGYQKCRKFNMEWAIGQLNSQFLNGKRLELDSIPWLLVRVFGSRTERGQLLKRAAMLVYEGVQKKIYPSKADLAYFSHWFEQLTLEQQNHKTLTWAGLRPATDNDLDNFREEISYLKNYFQTLGSEALIQRDSSQGAQNYFSDFTEIWDQSAVLMEFQPWNNITHDDCHGINHVACIAEMQKALSGPEIKPQELVNLLSNCMLSVESYRYLTELFFDYYNKNSLSPSEKEKLQRVISSINQNYHKKLKEDLDIPEVGVFIQCISKDNWNKMVRNKTLPVFNSNCPLQMKEKVGLWSIELARLVRLGILQATRNIVSSENTWEDNIFSRLGRYISWLEKGKNAGIKMPSSLKKANARFKEYFEINQKLEAENTRLSLVSGTDFESSYWWLQPLYSLPVKSQQNVSFLLHSMNADFLRLLRNIEYCKSRSSPVKNCRLEMDINPFF